MQIIALDSIFMAFHKDRRFTTEAQRRIERSAELQYSVNPIRH
jgi:hypothetical protein